MTHANPKGLINVDVDGVLYDFVGEMRDQLWEYGHENAYDWPEPDQWDLHTAWGISKKEFYHVMFQGIMEREVFRVGRLVDPEAPEVLRVLRGLGWHIRIVTAKTFTDREATLRARESTLQWLDSYRIPYDTISFTDKLGKKLYRANVVVDDKPDKSWTQWEARNILFLRPWNEHVQGDTSLEYARSWRDICYMLEGGGS